MVKRLGFSLVELLVVIGIIALLVGIAIPVINKARTAAYAASSQSQLAALMAAIEIYNQDFRAYPGPLANRHINNAPAITGTPGPNINGIPLTCPAFSSDARFVGVPATSNPAASDNNITGTENLVLGLMGGLSFDGTTFLYNPNRVGMGADGLNPNMPKRHPPLMTDAKWLSPGVFKDETGQYANDTIIPEFIDRFPDAMPILYIRANVGATKIAGHDWASSSAWPTYADAQYGVNQIQPYTWRGATGTRGINRPNGKYHGIRYVDESDPTKSGDDMDPGQFNLKDYLTNPQLHTARNKDGYILISAGKDRIYGTADDITNFGPVVP